MPSRSDQQPEAKEPINSVDRHIESCLLRITSLPATSWSVQPGVSVTGPLLLTCLDVKITFSFGWIENHLSE